MTEGHLASWCIQRSHLWRMYCESNMEMRKDGGGGMSAPSGASSVPAQSSCYKSALIVLLLLVTGLFVGLLIGESLCFVIKLNCTRTCKYEFDSSWKKKKKISSSSPPMLLPAYLVKEEHRFMETVQLKGLQYDPVLQEENSGYSIVLTSVLKSQVSWYSYYFGCSKISTSNVLYCTLSLSCRLKMSLLARQYPITTLIVVLLPMGEWNLTDICF